jgi:hypothetical protein
VRKALEIDDWCRTRAIYNSHGRTESGADFVSLPLRTGTLAPGASISIPVQLLTYGQAVRSTTFSLQGRRLLPEKSARLLVSAVYWEGADGSLANTSVGGGWEVFVDDAHRGVTKPDGRAELTIETDAKIVSVLHPMKGLGSAALPAFTAGSVTHLKVIVDDAKKPGNGSLLRIQESKLGVLPRTTPAVTLRVLKDEKAIKLVRFQSVSISGPDHSIDATDLFRVQPDGSAAAAGSAFRTALVGMKGPLLVETYATDALGNGYAVSEEFQFADHRIRIQLVAPPSNPTLSLEGIRIAVRQLDGDVRFVAESDANGRIVLPDVPAGNLDFSGRTRQGNVHYSAFGTAYISRDSLVRLTLMALTDVQERRVSPIVIEELPVGASRPSTSARMNATHSAAAAARSTQNALKNISGVDPRNSDGPSCNQSVPYVWVISTGLNADKPCSYAWTISQGTRWVALELDVKTEEYIFYRLDASPPRNDTWTISVESSTGTQLFSMSRSIFDQLEHEPRLLGGVGSVDTYNTGRRLYYLNVERQTEQDAATLVARATSSDTGDRQAATIVKAKIIRVENLQITSVRPDAKPRSLYPKKNPHTVSGDFYSIPRPGNLNHLQRTFAVDVVKPSGSVLTGVSLDLLDGDGNFLQNLLNGVPPGATGVSVVAQDENSVSLNVRATFENLASAISSVPPTTRDLYYRVAVNGIGDDNRRLEAERASDRRRALWRKPDVIDRYGTSDLGLDDWTARGTYNWLVANSGLIRRVDDISGEHGRNIGHDTHGHGTEVDAYHFYRFPNAVSGQDNFVRLRENLLVAFGTLNNPIPAQAADSYGRVSAWIVATRNGLTALAGQKSVRSIIYCLGLAKDGLQDDWCRSLIQTGTVSRTIPSNSGEPAIVERLDFGGNFSNSKVTTVRLKIEQNQLLSVV